MFPSPSCAMHPPPCPIAAICTCIANVLATLLPLPPSSTSVTHAPPICTHCTLFSQSHTTTHYTPSPRLLVQSCHFTPLLCSHWQLLAPVLYTTSSSCFYHGLAHSVTISDTFLFSSTSFHHIPLHAATMTHIAYRLLTDL